MQTKFATNSTSSNLISFAADSLFATRHKFSCHVPLGTLPNPHTHTHTHTPTLPHPHTNTPTPHLHPDTLIPSLDHTYTLGRGERKTRSEKRKPRRVSTLIQSTRRSKTRIFLLQTINNNNQQHYYFFHTTTHTHTQTSPPPLRPLPLTGFT